MCGIGGVFGCGSVQASYDAEELLAQMASLIGHRGPDEWGYYVEYAPLVGMVHTRLSVLGCDTGKQPMANDGLVLVFNGEIYNYIELRAELEGYGESFQTKSDTEVLLKAVKVWGGDAFEKFNGEWACAIFDSKRKKIHLCRDRYGIRPLYFMRHNGFVYFGSETKVFDAVKDYWRKLDKERLAEHGLLWNTTADSTVYQGIQSVVPGTVLTIDADGTEAVTRYYDLPSTVNYEITFDEAKEKLKELLVDAVKLRMRSDVPVATYLSGGLDSTLIASIVDDEFDMNPNSFSVQFSDERLDESPWQKIAAEAYSSEHKSVQIKNEDIRDNIVKTIYHGERPVFRTASVPMFLLSKLVSNENYKVVLSGEGADEVFCGYDSFKETKLTRFWRKHDKKLPVELLLKKLYPHLAHYSENKNLGLMASFYKGYVSANELDIAGIKVRLKNNAAVIPFLSDLDGIDSGSAYLNLLSEVGTDGGWAQIQQRMEFFTLLRGYLLSSQGDRMTMSHGVEGRFPFLDHRVVDFALQLPDKFKLKVFDQKHILKKTFEGQVPYEIVNRAKHPYQAPDIKAFVDNGKIHDMVVDLLGDDAVQRAGLFSKNMVNRLLKKVAARSEFGYRDNMLFTFILTSQICAQHCSNKHHPPKRGDKPRVMTHADLVERKYGI